MVQRLRKIIKVPCDFPDDAETEEESSDEPGEMFLEEYRPREMVKRMPCGHVCHENSMDYYLKYNIGIGCSSRDDFMRRFEIIVQIIDRY